MANVSKTERDPHQNFKPGEYKLIVRCSGIDEKLGQNTREFWLEILGYLTRGFGGVVEDESDLSNYEVHLEWKADFESEEVLNEALKNFEQIAEERNIQFGEPHLGIYAYRVVGGLKTRVVISFLKDSDGR